MEVYLAMFDSHYNEGSQCIGIFGTKISAEMEIERYIVEREENKDKFIRKDDHWSVGYNEYTAYYWIETHQVRGLTVTKPAIRK